MKAATLADLKNSLRDRFGPEVLVRDKPEQEYVLTGLGSLTFPRGTLSEITGAASSGRTSMLTALLARSTRRPEFCVLIDAGDTFDPASGREAGVQLSHLLWLRCGGSAEKALKAADLVIQSGGFGVVALDLASVPTREARRISLASWFRLRHAVEKTPTALIVVSLEHFTASCSTFHVESQATGFEVRDELLESISVQTTLGPRQFTKHTFALKAPYRI